MKRIKLQRLIFLALCCDLGLFSKQLIAHDGKIEPLIGIYDRTLAQDCEAVLKGTGSSIRRLPDRAAYSTPEYTGEPQLLTNCNTPEEYRAACSYV